MKYLIKKDTHFPCISGGGGTFRKGAVVEIINVIKTDADGAGGMYPIGVPLKNFAEKVEEHKCDCRYCLLKK